jgi:hypothetical protein
MKDPLAAELDDQQKRPVTVLLLDGCESGVGGRSRADDGLVAVGAFRPCFGGTPVGLGDGELFGRQAGGEVDGVGLDHGGAGLDEDLVVHADRPQPVVRGTSRLRAGRGLAAVPPSGRAPARAPSRPARAPCPPGKARGCGARARRASLIGPRAAVPRPARAGPLARRAAKRDRTLRPSATGTSAAGRSVPPAGRSEDAAAPLVVAAENPRYFAVEGAAWPSSAASGWRCSWWDGANPWMGSR